MAAMQQLVSYFADNSQLQITMKLVHRKKAPGLQYQSVIALEIIKQNWYTYIIIHVAYVSVVHTCIYIYMYMYIHIYTIAGFNSLGVNARKEVHEVADEVALPEQEVAPQSLEVLHEPVPRAQRVQQVLAGLLVGRGDHRLQWAARHGVKHGLT